MHPVPVLMYHSVGPVPDRSRRRGLFVPVAAFGRQMALLRRLGYAALPISEALVHLQAGSSRRVCSITFDDGFLDNVDNALPILKKHGHRATCYVVSDRIGMTNAWSQAVLGACSPLAGEDALRLWLRSGMEIGAHTRTHARLTRASDGELADEVSGSKESLERRFGVPVTQFCYPWGDHDDRVVRAVRDAGFTGATTTRRGRARASVDPLRVPRLGVMRHHWLPAFWLKVHTRYGDRP